MNLVTFKSGNHVGITNSIYVADIKMITKVMKVYIYYIYYIIIYIYTLAVFLLNNIVV